MMWYCGSANGIPATWYAKGWEPMQTDDYGNAVRVFTFMVKDYPYGWCLKPEAI